jgi:integrase
MGETGANTPQEAIDGCLKLVVAPQEPLEEAPKLWQVVARWLESYNVGKSEKTKYAMEHALKNFLLCADGKIESVQDITADHVRSFWQWEVDHSRTKSYRTAHNRCTALGNFLKAHDVVVKWKNPPFDESLPEVYEPEEIPALLGACDDRHRAAYSVMLQGLLREREVVYLARADVDAKRCIIHVRSKPEYNFRVKKHHERAVSVPRNLIDLIEALPCNGPLIFAREEDGQPDLKLLRYLKFAAVRAGINPKRAKLHSFRRTGATIYLQKGLPLQELMALGGWRDLQSVQRYCGLMNHERRQAAVEAAWAV